MKVYLALAFALLLAGCSPAPDQTGSGSGSSAPPTTPDSTTAAAPERASGEDAASRQPKEGDEVAVMTTNYGKIVLMFFPDVAPAHVENFKKLAKEGFYDGTKFHRVIPNFMIQGGDPNSKNDDRSDDGIGGSGSNVPAEFSMVDHVRGILSMARSQDPNSASSQFFIVVQDSPSLNQQYSAFGKVVSGMEVADKIKNLNRDDKDNPLPANPAIIESVKIVKWPVQ